jgi:ABC-type dipeptide/oligopeptide/nickel transport system permease component
VFTIVFALVSIIPGNPQIIDDLIAAKADEGVIQSMRDLFNLNDPFVVRYFKAFGDMFNGTFGMSGTYGVSASTIMLPKILLSFQIGFLAIAFSIIIGIPLGIALARRNGSLSDLMAGVVAIFAFAIPAFVVGIIFMFVSYVLGLPIIFEYGN